MAELSDALTLGAVRTQSAMQNPSNKPGPGLRLISDGTRSIYVPNSWLPMQSSRQFNTVVQSLLTKYVAPPGTSVSGDGSGGPSYSPPGGGGGGGGGVTINTPEQKKSNDKPQMEALKKMIGGFKDRRDIKLGNLTTNYKQADSDLLLGYEERAEQVGLAVEDNEKAEADASFANLVNRARERADILTETATMGAGESDTLRSQMMALQNWDANQDNINRSYFDTLRSANNSITDLNADTRAARIGAYQQLQGDRAQVWNDYFNDLSETYVQMGNITANPYSDAYDKGSSYFDKAADSAGKSYEDKGVPSSVRNWEGSIEATESRLNNSYAQAGVTNLAEKKPEGATLRKW